METIVDDPLRQDIERYSLRFRCEHCAHFDERSGRCAEGYPNDAHRDADTAAITVLVFCKSFELS